MCNAHTLLKYHSFTYFFLAGQKNNKTSINYLYILINSDKKALELGGLHVSQASMKKSNFHGLEWLDY